MTHKALFLSFVAVVFLGALAVPQALLAQTASPRGTEPKTVLDYYLLLPKEELSMLEATKKSRQALVKRMDAPNGFLALGTDEMEGYAQIALFRQKDREALIAVSQTEQAVSSSGGVKFLRYGGGKWSDVTAEVLPKIADKEILAAYNRIKRGDDELRTLQNMPAVYWELPIKGTAVEIRCGEDFDSKDKILMRFTWDGVRFTKQMK